VRRKQHGPACASTLMEPRSGDSKQGQDDTERSEVSACVIKTVMTTVSALQPASI